MLFYSPYPHFLRLRRKSLGFPAVEYPGSTSSPNARGGHHGYSPAMADRPIHRRGHSNPAPAPFLSTTFAEAYPISRPAPVNHHRSASTPHYVATPETLSGPANGKAVKTPAGAYYATVPSHLAPRLTDGPSPPADHPASAKPDSKIRAREGNVSTMLSVPRNLAVNGVPFQTPVHPHSYTITSKVFVAIISAARVH